MNIVKTGVAVLAVSAMVSVSAQDAEAQAETPAEESEAVVSEGAPAQEGRSYGWTPIAFGLATPVQLPWGIDRWDVFGLDFNIFYSDAPELCGLQLSVCGNTARREFKGVGLTGLFNFSSCDTYGFRGALGANISKGTLYGVDAGGFGMHDKVKGVELELVTCVQREITGANFSIFGSITENESYGATFGAVNFARTAYGAQIAFAYNQTEELHGCQIGLVNYCRECPWGFQIGLVNIILDNYVKVLPFVNGYF